MILRPPEAILRHVALATPNGTEAMSSNRVLMVALLFLAAPPMAMAHTHGKHHSGHTHSQSSPAYGQPDSGDAWRYENNHYLMILVR